MLPQAKEHIDAIERKERTEREQLLAQQSRDALVRQYHGAIADAERRKVAPCFLNEDAETPYRVLCNGVEQLAKEYEVGMRQARHSARPFPFGFDSPQAISYFFGDVILSKLPELADRISSRDGRGLGIDEGERQQVVAEWDEIISRNRALLAGLLGEAS